jgi:site-specific recombinase XerD
MQNSNANFKTPIEDIFFRSSKIGLLAGGLIRHGLTEKQREEMETLEAIKTTEVYTHISNQTLNVNKSH